MSFNIEVEGGSSVRLPTAGKYCDKDIVVSAAGGDTEGAYNEGYEAGQQEGFEAGRQEGYAAGQTAGYTAGQAEGVEQGKQAEYDSFWDTFQENGTRSIYSYAFHSWGNKIYKPKYALLPAAAIYMYEGCFITEIIVNLSYASNIAYTFSKCYNLTKLTITSSENTQWHSTTFSGTTTIVDLEVIGTIGKTFTISSCPNLTHASLMSIINALKDYSAGTGTYKLTIGATNLAKLTDAEKAIATEKGWTLA